MRSNIIVSELNKIKNKMTNCHHETPCIVVCRYVCDNKKKKKKTVTVTR